MAIDVTGGKNVFRILGGRFYECYFKKIGLTNQNPVLILNAPDEYKESLFEIIAKK
ncbi:hypothetical protein ACJDT4_01095 [Clostridium neuense]|uniref:Uncharacterized protein n=1 Tax=Clostridium neuense TaxID=1728934 RepID=A0ABW8T920_9CLOT